MLLNVTEPPGATGVGDAVAVMVTGIRLACVGIRVFEAGVVERGGTAGLAGHKNDARYHRKCAKYRHPAALDHHSLLCSRFPSRSPPIPEPFQSSKPPEAAANDGRSRTNARL